MGSEKVRIEVVLAAINKAAGPLLDVAKGSSAAAKALKAAKEQLKGLNDHQGKINSFNAAVEASRKASATYRDQKAALAVLGTKLNAAREAQANMVGVVKLARAEHKQLAAAFRKDDSIPGLASKLYDAKKNLEKLEGQYSRSINATRRFKEAIKLANHDLDGAKRAKDRESESLRKLSAAMQEVGLGTKGLAGKQADLAKQIELANSKVEKQRKIMDGLDAAHAKHAKLMGLSNRLRSGGAKVAGIGAGVNAVAAVPVVAYAKAENSATQLKIAMMQAGGKVATEFEKINDLAMKLGNRLPGTSSDFQDMMTMLIRQGMPAKSILGGLGEATAYLAVQMQMLPTEAAEFASKLQDATRTADKDMMGLMDTIQKTFYLGVERSNMLQGFAKLTPALSIIKKEGAAAAKALAPLLVLTDQAGMAGEAAGNAYRKIFQKSMDTDKIKKVLDGLAVEKGIRLKLDFTDGKGEFGGLENMYAQLAKLKGLNTETRLGVIKDLFGDDAETLQALSLMIEKGIDGYRDAQAKMDAQADIQRRVNEQLGTLRNLWDAATGTFTNVLVALGESIGPELHAMTEWLGELAEKIQRLAKENPGLSAAIMKTAAYGGMLAVALGGLVATASAVIVPLAALKFSMAYLSVHGFGLLSILGKIGAVFPLIGNGLLFLGRAMLTNPFGVLITGALLIYTYWEPISGFFGKVWDGVSRAFKLAWAEISQTIENVKAAGAQIIDGILAGISSKWEALKAKIAELASMLPEWLRKPLDINSPSRVFMAIGDSTMEGLEMGIASGQGGPLDALSRAARNITAAGAGMVIGGVAMAGGVPGAGGSVSGGAGLGQGNNFNFYIYAAPGMDARDIANEVRNEIARIERENSARSRSRLSDRD
jgi:TP901 family phage tail tape measure protein